MDDLRKPLCWLPAETVNWINTYDGSARAYATAVWLQPKPDRGMVPVFSATRIERDAALLREAREVIDYITQDELHNMLVPRIVDIAYSAFMSAHKPNREDGGATDWFTDTKPMVMEAIAEVRRELLSRLDAEGTA